MECCSILCFLNEASFPCMQMSCCRQLVFCEAVFYFGDKRPRDLFNRPLSLSMDLLAPNFSVGSGREKLERLIWTPRLHVHQGRGVETKRVSAGRRAVPLRDRACPPERRLLLALVPCAWHHCLQRRYGTCPSLGLLLVTQGGIRGKEIFCVLFT